MEIEKFAKIFAETIYDKLDSSIPYSNMGLLIQAFIDNLINKLVEIFSESFEDNFRLSRDFEDRLIESFENVLREKLDIKINHKTEIIEKED